MATTLGLDRRGMAQNLRRAVETIEDAANTYPSELSRVAERIRAALPPAPKPPRKKRST